MHHIVGLLVVMVLTTSSTRLHVRKQHMRGANHKQMLTSGYPATMLPQVAKEEKDNEAGLADDVDSISKMVNNIQSKPLLDVPLFKEISSSVAEEPISFKNALTPTSASKKLKQQQPLIQSSPQSSPQSQSSQSSPQLMKETSSSGRIFSPLIIPQENIQPKSESLQLPVQTPSEVGASIDNDHMNDRAAANTKNSSRFVSRPSPTASSPTPSLLASKSNTGTSLTHEANGANNAINDVIAGDKINNIAQTVETPKSNVKVSDQNRFANNGEKTETASSDSSSSNLPSILQAYTRKMRKSAYVSQLLRLQADKSEYRAMLSLMRDASAQEILILEKTSRPWVPGLDVIGKTFDMYSGIYGTSYLFNAIRCIVFEISHLSLSFSLYFPPIHSEYCINTKYTCHSCTY
jgi:hypothetical protein